MRTAPDGPADAPAPATLDGPSLAQTIGTPNVDAISYADTSFVPPDPSGDAGLSQYLVAANGGIRVLDKSTGLPDGTLNATLNAFFDSVRIGTAISPRIRYDRRAERWFVIAVTDAAPNYLLVAVSAGSQITSASAWTFFRAANSYTGPGGTPCVADLPTLGIDEDALYIGVNEYCGTPATTFTASLGLVINKAALVAGSLTTTSFVLAEGDGPGLFSPVGVDNFDNDTSAGYFIGVDNAAVDRLQIRRVLEPGSPTPTLFPTALALDVPPTELPIPVPHPGSTVPLSTIDDRLNNAVLRNGRLWTSHQIEVNAAGGAEAGGGRTAIRWYELQDVNTTPTLRQSGTLFDSSETNPRSYFMGSLMVSGQGHMALGATVAGATTFVNAVTTGRLASDPLGQLNGAPVPYTNNTTVVYDRPERDPGPVATQPWGGYSATNLDAADDMTMWTLQEYVSATNSWAMRLVKLVAPPPPAILSITPAVVTIGRTAVTVTVNGDATSGGAFFDPGPGFVNRISGAFTGSGITVTGAAVISATQLTLTLDTTAASAGTYPIVITNPDGQSVSRAGVLEVEVNIAPTASPDNYSTPAFGTLTVPAPGVLSNDTDPNGEPLVAVVQAPPAHGTVALNPNGSFTYTPTAGYSGPDTFTYAASDGLLSSGAATVSINVTPNAPPVAGADSYTTAYGTPLNVAAPGVLANDSDADGEPLTAVFVSGPSNGTLTLNTNGSFLYTPSTTFAGTDSFTYRASDGSALSAVTTVTLTVSQPTSVQPASGLYAASVTGNQVTLRWTPPAIGVAPTTYVIEGGVTPGQVLASIPTNSPAPIYTFIAPTGSFYVRVHAIAGTLRSAASNEIRLHVNVPVRPSAPAGLVTLVNGSTLNLAWRNTFEGGAPTSLLLDVSGSLTTTIPLGVSNGFGFAGVPAGTYTLRLRAANPGGASPPSEPVTVTFPGACSGAPQTPVNVLAYRIGRTVSVVWDPALAGGAPTAFTVNVTGGFNGSFSTTGRSLSGTVNPGNYTITVVARNACGNSAATAPQTLTVP